MSREVEPRNENQIYTPYSEPVSFYTRTQYSQKLYIGSNNETHKVETDKIIDYLNKKLQGYTFWYSTGYWEGTGEQSVVVEIIADAPPLTQKDIEELRDELKQYAILTTLTKIEVALV
jgi:hypothetical protein